MFPRKEIIRSPEYWLGHLQNELYGEVDQYMKEHKLNRTQFAQQLGVSKGYVSQILNGNFNHRLIKLIELSLAIGKAPIIQFEDVENYMNKVPYSNDKLDTSTPTSKTHIHSTPSVEEPPAPYLPPKDG